MTALDTFNARLDAGEIIIMDGGTGTEIHRRGAAFDPKTWSGSPMLEYPDLVREIHEDYLRAGADIIIANTFGTSRSILEEGGMGDRTEEANEAAVRVAREAIENAAPNRDVLLVGSMATINPLGDPNVPVSYDAALKEYREQAGYLADAGVDVIAAEMIIRIVDAKAAVVGAAETDLPVWMGFSSIDSDGKQMLGLHSWHRNESLKEAVKTVEPLGVSMFHTMHSLPSDTAPAFREIKETTKLPVGAYAHTIGDEIADMSFKDGFPEMVVKQNPSSQGYLQFARGWADLGAQVIGGCCGTTPDHIRALKEGLPQKVSASGRVTTVS